MSAKKTYYSAEETARRGDEIYERTIRDQVEANHYGKVIAIDIETGAYVIDDTALIASQRLRAQYPHAIVWFVRVGHRALHRIGGRSIMEYR
ncbi:MAG: hypothetical protein C4527_17905 [Candidatus Omnitrophota bacterium]|jgi:hypothetical protein|nr:MAG: hypothetical protein C4527_17905 [Candidatus Omnitrophota bacterium]